MSIKVERGECRSRRVVWYYSLRLPAANWLKFLLSRPIKCVSTICHLFTTSIWWHATWSDHLGWRHLTTVQGNDYVRH